MTLESGKYAIFSKVDGAPVGRAGNFEDNSGHPKAIFKLSNDAAHATNIWEVEKLENGNYKIRFVHRIVGGLDGHLFALIVEIDIESAETEWTLQRDERDTEGNAYVVKAAGQQDGWVAPTVDDEQIAIKPILAGLTIPPTFSSTEVFVFKKSEGQAE